MCFLCICDWHFSHDPSLLYAFKNYSMRRNAGRYLKVTRFIDLMGNFYDAPIVFFFFYIN